MLQESLRFTDLPIPKTYNISDSGRVLVCIRNPNASPCVLSFFIAGSKPKPQRDAKRHFRLFRNATKHTTNLAVCVVFPQTRARETPSHACAALAASFRHVITLAKTFMIQGFVVEIRLLHQANVM
ncbi:hypothetical protein VNO78_30392 [Psophocarpus tetragonolobus]|uniref:Uncharacterized protein n=1 Tax=Psophocarpus tetragonolobus TaxID=3891 RepID=A0AAN9X6H7_PSOTE